jgi:hypothetical protein
LKKLEILKEKNCHRFGGWADILGMGKVSWEDGRGGGEKDVGQSGNMEK